ncbi:MAG: hypothetical protein ABH951_01795 [Patescibacteria group bacterium]
MEPTKKSHGALIGSIIIILVLIIGGVYIWQQKVKTIKEEPIQTEEQKATDEINSLEQEINSIDTNIDVNIDELE